MFNLFEIELCYTKFFLNNNFYLQALVKVAHAVSDSCPAESVRNLLVHHYFSFHRIVRYELSFHRIVRYELRTIFFNDVLSHYFFFYKPT